MYVVEHCPEDLFRPGATFTVTGFDYTLEIGGWPEGTIFTGRGRRVVIQNGQVVELQDDDHRDGEYRSQMIDSEVRSICRD
jgi:uncharacterized protein YeaC (DUF1315 family)